VNGRMPIRSMYGRRVSAIAGEQCSRLGEGRALHWRAISLGLACAALVGCGSSARSQSHVDASAPPSRYWLSHSAVLSTPGGNPSAQIDAPVLVDLWPDGRVKSLAGSSPIFDGFLPEDVRTDPQSDRGLMLIAQTEVELHWGAPDGALAGHLYPGARVSVIPGTSPSTRVGNLPFAIARDQALFAERAKLGVTPHVWQTPHHVAPVRAVQLPGLTGWVKSNAPDRTEEAGFTMHRCRDTLVLPDRAQLAQYVRGVELFGIDSDRVNEHFPGANFYESLDCPAHVVSEDGARLLWNDPDSELPRVAIERPPEHYRRMEPAASERLEHALRGGRSLYWLLRNEDGIVCDEWQFTRARPADPGATLSARLRRRKRFQWGAAQNVSFSVTYSPGKGRAPAVLKLDSPAFNGQPALRCACSYQYKLLAAHGEELTMMGRPLPDTFVAYDPREAERWFLSEDACQSARAEVSSALERDATSTTRVGLHAAIAALGI
jgi:hypothetical protein